MSKRGHPHKRLRLNSREIRIVTLFPGFWDDSIVCSTQVVSLNDAPSFSALSYSWGDRSKVEDISLDGEVFSVMKNLARALRHLRQQVQPLRIWIDFMSIDQNDLEEKAWQVNMMGDIYRACDEALLWLGIYSEDTDRWCEIANYEDCGCEDPGHLSPPHREKRQDSSEYRLSWGSGSPSRIKYTGWLLDQASPPLGSDGFSLSNTSPSPYAYEPENQPRRQHDTGLCKWHGRRPKISEAFAIIELFAQNSHINSIPGFANLVSPENTESHPFVEPIQALNALMRRVWWERIWTVQEAVLPKKASIVCGPLRISLSTVTLAANSWHRHSNTCCSIVKDRLYSILSYQTHGEPTYMAFSNFYRNIKSLERVKPGSLDTTRGAFLRTYQLFCNRQASDVRDKVFGLLGIIGKNDLPVQADYRTTMMAINWAVSKGLLLAGEFEILYDGSNFSNFPMQSSWIKDFGQTLSQVEQRLRDLRSCARRDYNSAASTKPDVHYCSGMTLSVGAVWIGSVKEVSGEFLLSENASVMKGHLRECAAMINFPDRKNLAYPRGGLVKDAFCRATFGDRFPSAETQSGVRRPKETEISRFKEWVWDLKEVPLQTRYHLGNVIKYNVCNRRFFVTGAGLMGFGPSEMRAGDEVWVFKGAKVPFVLRKLDVPIEGHEDNGVRQGEPGYTAQNKRAVIGDCYVHGIMAGEAFVDGDVEMTVILA